MTRLIILPLALLVLHVGCDRPGGGGTAANAPVNSPLQPFEGSWQFDPDKTLALWQGQGVSAADLAQVRALGKVIPLHPDMVLRGTSAQLSGPIEGEYSFFAMHPHNQWVCGKAWHHEDRHDPGDMSKCYARLELRDNQLHLSVRVQQSSPALNDPDLTSMPLTGGSVASCDADAAPNPPWDPWMTYIFQRR